MNGRRINVWSGPRNVSTALMYAFRQRRDTTVVDEPLYAHYLRVTGTDDHPAIEEVLAAQDADGERVVRDVLLGPWPTDVVMFKQMAHHLVGLDRGWLDRCTNILLVRDPAAVLASYVKQVERPTVAGLGYPVQVELLERALARGEAPVVVRSEALRAEPAATLSRLCQRIALDFDPAMLSWPAGPKPEDGVWAPHWYANVHRSTGFAPPADEPPAVPARLAAILEEARPLHDRLVAHAI